MNPKIFLDMAKNLGGGKGGNTVELPAPQGWYDRLLNAINRTGRPLLLVAVIAFFWWGIHDPVRFVLVMKAFATTPEWITTAVLMVIGIFGTGRIIGDVKRKNTLTQQIPAAPIDEPAAEISDRPVVEINIDGRFRNLDDNDTVVMEDAEEIRSSDMENDAIAAWKNKNAAS